MGNWLGRVLARQAPPGTDWFASTSGTAGGSGTIGSPWDLTTGLTGGTGGTAIQPGDRLNVRGGTYTGLFTSTLTGTGLKPITIRPYQSEKPKIDGYVTTTLGGNIDNVVTSIPMTQLTVPDGTVIDIDNEAIRIHGYSGGNYVGVDRGWNGTTAASHTSGTQIWTESGQCLIMAGDYGWYYGIECTVSVSRYASRTNPQAGSNPFGRPAGGIDGRGNYNKAINCIVHDCADGITTANVVANNFEFHGCISYYNGWTASDRGHGHNFYIHNDNPGTSLVNIGSCVSMDAFDIGAQIFTGGSALGNVQVDKFIGVNAGTVSTFGPQLEMLMGFDPGPITNSSFTNGATYAGATPGDGISVGYNAGNASNFTLTGNYFASQDAACIVKPGTTFNAASGNVYVGPSSAPNPSSGTFLSWKPVSGKTFVVANNIYETGRANIAVFNWDHSATVALDFSTFLNNGDTYVVRNAWDYFGTPITSGTYGGGTVTVNASGLTVSAPVGLSAPTETGTEFNVYIVSKT